MWLGEKIAREPCRETDACGGIVSMGGEKPAVVTDGEARDMTVFSPGGYAWQPEKGAAVAVLQEAGAVLGMAQQAAGLAPGEVKISSKAAVIYLATAGFLRHHAFIGAVGEACQSVFSSLFSPSTASSSSLSQGMSSSSSSP